MASATGEKTSMEGSTNEGRPLPEPRQPPFPWTPPSIQELLQKREDVYTIEEDTKAWSDAAEIVKVYSDDMIRRWNGEIDTYLVYAGLFSAILTAFNVQSYLLLQPAPPDPSLLALQQISAQLSSFSTNPPFINSTQPAFQQADTPPPPVPRAAVWLNVLWFSSLILSLSSASVGIIVKQWINEYNSGISSGTSRKTAQLRQYRLNSLIEWRVRYIVMVIPILLQLALALFLGGLLILLWMLDHTVAAVASVLVGLLMAFVLTTMFLPLVKAGCCYISPQTLALYVICARISRVFKVLRYRAFWPLWVSVIRMHAASSGTAERLLAKIRNILRVCAGRRPQSGTFQTWRGREQSIIMRNRNVLDADLVVMAYDTTMDPETLSIAGVCFSRLPPATVIDCFERLHDADERHFGSGSPIFAHVALSTGMTANNMWMNAIVCLLSVDVQERDERWERLMNLLDGYLMFGVSFVRPGLHKRHIEWTLTALSAIALDVAPPSRRGVAVTAFQGVDLMLSWIVLCEEDSIDETTYEYAAAASACRLRQPVDAASWEDVCNYALVSTVFLQCVAKLTPMPSTTDSTRNILQARAQDALRSLSSALRSVNTDDIAKTHLRARTHRVTRMPTFLVRNYDALGALVSQDLISSLEYAVTLFQDVIRWQGLLDGSYREDFEIAYAALKQLKANVSALVQPAEAGQRA